MGQPKHIQGYEAEWSLIAQQLSDGGTILLPLADKRAAARLRFRFYGFRRALCDHDPQNPWIAALMESQATITPEGNLHIERSPYAAVLRGILEHSIVKTPAAPPPPEVKEAIDATIPIEKPLILEPTQSEHEQTILDILSHKPQSNPKE